MRVQISMDQDDGRAANAGSRRGQRQGQRPWRFAPVAVLIALLGLIVATGFHRYLTLEHLIVHRAKLAMWVDTHYLGAILGYAIIYVVAVATSLPGGAVLTLLGGLLFGWLIGGVVAVGAATAGAIIVFLAARTALGESLRKRAGPRLSKLADGFRQDAFNYLLFLRLVPVFPFWLVNLAPALLGVGLGTYALATAIGIVPGTFVFAVIGSGFDSVIDAQTAAYESCRAAGGPGAECGYSLSVSSLVTPEIIAALVLLGAMSLIPVIARRLLRKSPRTD